MEIAKNDRTQFVLQKSLGMWPESAPHDDDVAPHDHDTHMTTTWRPMTTTRSVNDRHDTCLFGQ